MYIAERYAAADFRDEDFRTSRFFSAATIVAYRHTYVHRETLGWTTALPKKLASSVCTTSMSKISVKAQKGPHEHNQASNEKTPADYSPRSCNP